MIEIMSSDELKRKLKEKRDQQRLDYMNMAISSLNMKNVDALLSKVKDRLEKSDGYTTLLLQIDEFGEREINFVKDYLITEKGYFVKYIELKKNDIRLYIYINENDE